jgi:DNA/RNA-binding domain of Phe-tRNA-synthetase-like protein
MRLDSSVKNKYPTLTIGYAVARNVKIERIVSELEKEKRRAIDEVREEYASVPMLEISEIRRYREFYKSMNVDPTKIRPATEYLFRKVLAGKFLTINNLVDSCLLASVKHWAIVSVYDLDRMKGVPTVILAKGTETLQSIDGRNVTPAVGEVLLRDDEKILTAYTLGDAKATMVTPQTKNVLMTAWNAPGISRQRVENALNAAIDYAKRLCQATVKKSEIPT